MGTRKKRKPLPPRTKRMNRKQRIQSAARRLREYDGSNVVRSYRKRYGVDLPCAIKEIQLLGVEIDPEYVSQLRQTVKEQAKKNHEKRLDRQKSAAAKKWSERYPFSEGYGYFVAGHAEKGVPYGVTWEETRKQGLVCTNGLTVADSRISAQYVWIDGAQIASPCQTESLPINVRNLVYSNR